MLILWVLIHPCLPMDLEISAGAFWREISDSITYEASIPLVYESAWDTTPIEKTKLTGNVCKTGAGTSSCFAIQKIQQLLSVFEVELESLLQSQNTALQELEKSKHSVKKRALAFVGDALSWCCDVATNHELNQITADEYSMRRQLDILSNDLPLVLMNISKESVNFQNFENATVNNLKKLSALSGKLENYVNNLHEELKNYYNEHAESVVALTHGLFSVSKHNMYMAKFLRKQNTMSSCRNHQIPSTILTPDVLRSDLYKLKTQLEKSLKGLAIPDSDFLRHFEIPICTCSFSHNKILIQVKIPITQLNRSWKLFELTTTPFAWHGHTCSIEHDTTLLAIANHDQEIRKITGLSINNCHPHENKLCFLPRFSTNHPHGPDCAKMLFLGATVDEITRHCPLKCHETKTQIIAEVEKDVFSITNPVENLIVTCENEIKQVPQNASQLPGALKFVLPCSCALQADNKDIIPKRFPCADNSPKISQITHIIPAAWTNLKSFVLNPINNANTPIFKNLSECLNQNWTIDIPFINVTSHKNQVNEFIKNIEAIRSAVPEYQITQHVPWHGDILFLLWNSVLSFLVIYLLFKNNNMIAVLTHSGGASAFSNKLQQSLVWVILGVFSLFCIYALARYIIIRSRKRNAPDVPLVPQGKKFVMYVEQAEELEVGKRVICIIPNQDEP